MTAVPNEVLLRRITSINLIQAFWGWGDLKAESEAHGSIAAMFDLEGFTTFCKQTDPHLSVPLYLSNFLNWIFGEIRKETIKDEHEKGYFLWHALPFLVKFMGDGVLVLWNTKNISAIGQHNLILSPARIFSTSIIKNFFPKSPEKYPRLLHDSDVELQKGLCIQLEMVKTTSDHVLI